MTRDVARTLVVPRIDAPLGLLLIGLAVVLFIAWPDRPVDANGSWYAVAIARHVGLALVALAAALRLPVRRPHDRPRDLVDVGLAWLMTVPFEVVAWYGTVPSDSLMWSLGASLVLAWSVYGIVMSLSVVAARMRLGWAMPLLLPLAALGVGWLDVRTGPVFVLPWLVPFVPSWWASGLLGSIAALTLTIVVRRAFAAEVRS